MGLDQQTSATAVAGFIGKNNVVQNSAKKLIQYDTALDGISELYGLTEQLIDTVQTGELYNTELYVPHVEKLVSKVEESLSVLTKIVSTAQEAKSAALTGAPKAKAEKMLRDLKTAIEQFQHVHNTLK